MAGNCNEEEISEKEREFRELMCVYSEMGEKLYAMEKELGYVDEEKEKLRKEFEVILDPAGFFILGGIDKIEHPRPPRDVYQVVVMRKLPIEIETGKSELP